MVLAWQANFSAAAPTVGQGWKPYLSLRQQEGSGQLQHPSTASQELDPKGFDFDATSHLGRLPSQLQSNSYLVGDDDWRSYNDSQLTPLLPREIVWLMELVEQRIHNKSSLPTQLQRAITLARYTSVVYCDPPNILAWNCTRYYTSWIVCADRLKACMCS